jgi:catechol 2,3-dioxygenase-like lactoylglutathione lyase family enzyme
MGAHFGFKHIAVRVSNVARAAAFYDQVLGLKEVLTQDEGRMTVLGSPGARDVLTLSESSVSTELEGLPVGTVGEMGGVDHFGIEVDDRAELDAVVDRCLVAGGQLVGRVELRPGFPSAFIRDLDGYLLQIYSLSPQLRGFVTK